MFQEKMNTKAEFKKLSRILFDTFNTAWKNVKNGLYDKTVYWTTSIFSSFSQFMPYTSSISTLIHELGHASFLATLGKRKNLIIINPEPYVNLAYPEGKVELLEPLNGVKLNQLQYTLLYASGPIANLIGATVFGYIAKSINREKHPILKGIFGGLAIWNAIEPVLCFISSMYEKKGDFYNLTLAGPVGNLTAFSLPLVGAYLAIFLHRKLYKTPSVKQVYKQIRKEREEREKQEMIEYWKNYLPKEKLPWFVKFESRIRRKNPIQLWASEVHLCVMDMELEINDEGNYQTKDNEVKRIAEKYGLSPEIIHNFLKKYKIV